MELSSSCSLFHPVTGQDSDATTPAHPMMICRQVRERRTGEPFLICAPIEEQPDEGVKF